MKKCCKCKQTKYFPEFSKNKRYKDGYHDTCKQCRIEYNQNNKDKVKEYYNKTIDKQLEYGKEWRDKNKPYTQEYSKKHYKENKKAKKEYHKQYLLIGDNKQKHQDKIKEWFKNNPNYSKEYVSERYKNDINFKLKSNLRSRFFNSIKNESKISSVLKLLGCTIKELKQYLEKQFKPEMNWENWGEIWELDHIISCCSFNLNKFEEQKKCFHYTNLQPLFKTTKIAESFGYINEVGNRDKKKN
jgi:uncharacterized protein with HEPN domain